MGQWTRTGSRGRAGEWSAELDSFSKLDLRIASNLTISPSPFATTIVDVSSNIFYRTNAFIVDRYVLDTSESNNNEK